MLFYFKGGFENAKKNQGALKVVSDCFLILRGAFKMPEQIQGGGTKNAFNFQRGLFHCQKLLRGASKLNDWVLQHFSEN